MGVHLSSKVNSRSTWVVCWWSSERFANALHNAKLLSPAYVRKMVVQMPWLLVSHCHL